MFCVHCGFSLPDFAAFCSKCGNRLPDAKGGGLPGKQGADQDSLQLREARSAPAQRELQEQNLEPDMPRDILAPNHFSSASTLNDVPKPGIQPQTFSVIADAKPNKGAAAYGWFIFSLICFTVSSAAAIFLMASAVAVGSPDAFPKGGPPLIGLIFTAIWAKQSWSKIVVDEPETNDRVRRKHKLFLVKAAAVVSLALIAAGYTGVYLGHRRAEVESITVQMASLGAKTAPVKQRFIQLARQDTPTIPDYLRRCTDLESALNEYEPALRQMLSLLAQMQTYLKDDPTSSEAFETMRSIVQKDLESASSFRNEISNAKILATLPDGEQLNFYDQKIKPAQAEELRIANDEIEIMRNAKARGVKLPAQMYKEAGIE